MQAWFDNVQQQLAGLINNPTQNNVGYFVKEIFNNQPQAFAGGGLADNTDTTNSDFNLAQRIANSATKTVQGADNSVLGGRYGDSPLGQGFYNSAPYIASHYTNLGKFFSGAEPGNFYTNRYQEPVKGQPPKSEDPNAFYSRWYESQRRFAEASEVADRGQTITRPR